MGVRVKYILIERLSLALPYLPPMIIPVISFQLLSNIFQKRGSYIYLIEVKGQLERDNNDPHFSVSYISRLCPAHCGSHPDHSYIHLMSDSEKITSGMQHQDTLLPARGGSDNKKRLGAVNIQCDIE